MCLVLFCFVRMQGMSNAVGSLNLGGAHTIARIIEHVNKKCIYIYEMDTAIEYSMFKTSV